MDIREIRVGNYYYFNHPDTKNKDIVIKMTEKMLYAMFENPLNYGLKFYSPILLTEEILINAGFDSRHLIIIENIEFQYYFHFKELLINSKHEQIGIGTNIDYFHQLQNIVFDLTKKEIEFKI